MREGRGEGGEGRTLTIIMVCEKLLRTWITKKDICYPYDYGAQAA